MEDAFVKTALEKYPRYAKTYDKQLRKLFREAFAREQARAGMSLARKHWWVVASACVALVVMLVYASFVTSHVHAAVVRAGLNNAYKGAWVGTAVLLTLGAIVTIGWRRHVTGITSDSLWVAARDSAQWTLGRVLSAGSIEKASPYMLTDENYNQFVETVAKKSPH